MLLNITGINIQTAAFPDLTELNPKSKNKGYCMQYGRAYISHCLNSGSRDFYLARINGRYKMAADYANGIQRVKAILKDADGTPDIGGDKINLRQPLKLLKKSLRAVDGKLKDHDFVATVTAIDATAQDERKDYENRMRVQMQHGEWLKSMGIDMGGPQGQGADIPVDEDELAQHMEVKYRHRDAYLLEMKLSLALYLAKYDQQNRLCLQDETTYGSSVLFLGLRGALRLPQRINPGNCFFLPADSEDYPNLQAGAHVEKISLAQLLKEVAADPDTTLSTADVEQLQSIARQNMTNGGNGYYYDDTLGHRPEMAGQLEVVRFSFKSQDEEVRTEGTTKFGNPIIREKPASYATERKDVKVHRRQFSNWYGGTLIVGTELGYGCGKVYEQMRDEDNPFDCHPLYIVTSPDMRGGYTESVVEQCYVLVDMACEAWVKLRHLLNTMVGSWTEFDIDAIEAGALQKGNGDKMSASETIAHFFKNRYIAARKTVDGYEGKVGNIVTSGELPFQNELAEYWNTIAQCRQQIEDVTGINGSIAADDPASRQGAATTQLAIAGAENTLDYLYFAKQSRFERVCRALAVSIKQSEARSPLTGPVPPGFRGNGEELVGTSDTLGARVIQTKIERKPTDKQWDTFYGAANQALAQKEITLADFGFIQNVDNLKQAQVLLGIRAKRNVMQASQAAQQRTSMTSQQQQESAQVKGDQDRQTLTMKYDRETELEKMKIEGQIALGQIQASGHVDATEMTNTVKLIAQQMAQVHAGQQADAQRQAAMMQTNQTLESGEQENQAARDHEASMQQAGQPTEA